VKDAVEYLAQIKALIVLNPHVTDWTTVREEAQGGAGLFRYRLTLHDGSLLEMFELFYIVDQKAQVTKYSFHWQDARARLRKRWDNASHHPELPTHPHHVHDGAEEKVLSHQSVNAREVLAIIATETQEKG
jgi:hypothetical protein